MSEWISVKDRLPKLGQIVIICYASGYDGAPIIAWGARVDECEGWLWGEARCGDIRPDMDEGWNQIEADDDYKVTHWMAMPKPPFRKPARKVAADHSLTTNSEAKP